MDDVTAGWSIPWARTGHYQPAAIRALMLTFDPPSDDWTWATRTRIFVRSSGWGDISITVVGISEPIADMPPRVPRAPFRWL